MARAFGYLAADLNQPTIDGLTAIAGTTGAVLGSYKAWSEPWYSSDYARPNAAGCVSVIGWEPSAGNATDPTYRLSAISSPTWHAYIDQMATDVKAQPGIVVMRLAYEMNGPWMPYCESVNGNAKGQFVVFWHRVVDRFRAKGVTNVRWCWSVNIETPTTVPLCGLYPGDDYVDVVGIDGYNWGTYQGATWQPYSSVIGPTYDVVTGIAPSKPVWVTELGCSPDVPPAGDKAGWFSTLATEVANRTPRVSGLMYFQRNKPPEPDWRVDADAGSACVWRHSVVPAFTATKADVLATLG